MKKLIFLSVSSLVLFATSCGPAAEDRENMHARAKVVADSLANMIKTKMADAEGQTPAMQTPPDTSKNQATPH